MLTMPEAAAGRNDLVKDVDVGSPHTPTVAAATRRLNPGQHASAAAVPDSRPIEAGEVFENPVTRERAVLIEAPWRNAEGRAVADMTALPGTRVVENICTHGYRSPLPSAKMS
jgi:hypothetical protein